MTVSSGSLAVHCGRLRAPRAWRFSALPLLIVMAALIHGEGIAAAQPDPRQMSGVPLPVSDVAVGTVTVRVIRGSLANPVPSQTVEITGAAEPMRATTNDVGRAEIRGLRPGVRVKAHATVAGERLESQEFDVPATGGIRLILAAADPNGGAASAAVGSTADPAKAPSGEIALGEESRFVFEMGEEGLSVFYILQIVNPGQAPAEPRQPLVFELPSDATGATVLQGSSPQASVTGRTLQVKGPFAPGPTLVQLAYTMPYSGADLTLEQRLPATLTHVAVVAQKVGDLQLASPQIAEQRTMPAQGNLYIAGRGGAVPAGESIRFRFSGMPHHPTWPRNLALALAAIVLGGGAWGAWHTGSAHVARAAARRQLERDRERLFEELSALERRGRADNVAPDAAAAVATKRRELVAALERVYAALDEEPVLGRAS